MDPVPRIRQGLLRHALDDQVLVYDTSKDELHLLDRATATVLELLEEGGWTVEGITGEIADRTGLTRDPGFLSLAIEELRRTELLDETTETVAAMGDLTRRDVMKRLMMTGMAAALLPAIATVTATRGMAQTVGNVASCLPCTTNEQCIPPNTCISGAGGNRCSGGANPTGQLSGQQGLTPHADPSTCQARADAQCCTGVAVVLSCDANSVTYICR